MTVTIMISQQPETRRITYRKHLNSATNMTAVRNNSLSRIANKNAAFLAIPLYMFWRKITAKHLQRNGERCAVPICNPTKSQRRNLRLSDDHPHQTSHCWDNVHFVELNELHNISIFRYCAISPMLEMSWSATQQSMDCEGNCVYQCRIADSNCASLAIPL